jgi:stage V sporulation protein R
MSLVRFNTLPTDLAELQVEIEGYARQYGLDFYPTIFEVVDYEQLNEIAAFGGFPTRYPHWRFGMEYEQLSKSYAYGLSKIYEMVINNNPCYAYLLKSNELCDQKLVMAHVYGHCDFFKNNAWFSHTSRKMMDEMANHGNRIRRYMDRFGVDEVETFIDTCLSIEDLIDVHSTAIRRKAPVPPPLPAREEDEEEHNKSAVNRFPAKAYLDPFINPPDVLAAEAKREQNKEREPERFPAEPVRDVMLFLLEHAPLKPWQLDVLSIVRDEAFYFAPQGQTKIMNEGWASYWHSTIMTRQGLAGGDVVNYADHHSGTMASSRGRLNPYKLGIELFRHIEERWNKGRFGKEYDHCDDLALKRRWNTEAGLGRQKIFEVRRIYNDLMFIDEFLTPEFCREQNMFSYAFNRQQNVYEIESREFPRIKERLLANLTNMGRPIIYLRDANYKNRGELFLEHRFAGVELMGSYAKDTLANLHRLWTRPVHIETVVEGVVTVLSYDGSEHKQAASKSPPKEK